MNNDELINTILRMKKRLLDATEPDTVYYYKQCFYELYHEIKSNDEQLKIFEKYTKDIPE